MEYDNVFSLTFNTDGIDIHPTSKCNLWPILLTSNFLPQNIRFREKNMIVAALHYSEEKPIFLKYFEPLNQEFEHLSQTGLFVKSKCFKFVITHVALHLPAKCSVQCIMQFNGFNACFYCHHPGEKTEKGIRYTILQQATSRTHSNMISDMQTALRTQNTCNGVKGISPMVGFKHFDLVKSFIIDYMHAILLGIVKNLLSFW